MNVLKSSRKVSDTVNPLFHIALNPSNGIRLSPQAERETGVTMLINRLLITTLQMCVKMPRSSLAALQDVF